LGIVAEDALGCDDEECDDDECDLPKKKKTS